MNISMRKTTISMRLEIKMIMWNRVRMVLKCRKRMGKKEEEEALQSLTYDLFAYIQVT